MEEPPPSHTALVRGSACLICRRKKRRCDAGRPACGPCVRTGTASQCVYPSDPEEEREKWMRDRIEKLQDDIKALERNQSCASPVRVASPLLPMATASPPSCSNRSSRSGSSAHHPLRRRTIGPSPLDVPVSLRDPPVALLKQRDVPPGARDPLIETFMKMRWQCNLEWNLSKFWTTYRLPPSHPDSIHPALLDAICLIGSLYNPTPIPRCEDLFYARLQRSLVECLSNADRLYDFIRASLLAGLYCCVKKRWHASRNHLGGTIQFAVAYGLNNIDSYDMRSSIISPLLRHSRDVVEMGDLVHTWWGAFLIDCTSALLYQSPCVISQSKAVKTLWPCAFESYINGQATRAEYSGVSSLDSLDASQKITASVYNNVYAFRAKSAVMFHRAIALGSSHQDKQGDQVHDTRVAIGVASHLYETMVTYREKVCPTFSRRRNYDDDGHDGTLICAMSITHGALIRLFDIIADTDADAYQQRLATARTCLALGFETYRADPFLFHHLLILPWCASYEVLALEMDRLNKQDNNEAAVAVRLEIEILMELLKCFVGRFDNLKKKWPIQNLRRFGIHAKEILEWME
ncbi:hypothetical protein BOTBODRAFT_184834 [Botryobasidium botryosum FD-172 SS1]|uniref:Zn(2)-C6 fungal-type domain-containing protein n=1 Tax=Botryobasidium botryosum (strain FD-172 SS1) TaxID=930990 RepID=A0A067MWG0_BOTB1|nr:hypothetical protein BOTBODRAFT_184834 [Botryobasidium botryosum FD-172 SS1]